MVPSDPGFHETANGRNGWRVEDVYQIGTEIKGGAFATVYHGEHKTATESSEWKHVAIKKFRPTVLDKKKDAEKPSIETYDDLESYCNQVKVLLHLKKVAKEANLPLRVLHVHEIFMSGKDIYMVTEVLHQSLDMWRQEQDSFPEKKVKELCRTMLEGISFLHRKNVVHRNLKLQGMLIDESGNPSSLKIASFALAHKLDNDDETLNDFCGSLGCIAPEIYKAEPYRFEVDMFCFGVILYRLLSGDRPFNSNEADEIEIRRDTMELRYSMSGRAWSEVSGTAKDLVSKLLAHKDERLTADQALSHKWFSINGE